ncbi:MAG: hypothetical protein ACRYG8_54220 [Janthinobacterium lividum]
MSDEKSDYGFQVFNGMMMPPVSDSAMTPQQTKILKLVRLGVMLFGGFLAVVTGFRWETHNATDSHANPQQHVPQHDQDQ